MTPQSSDVGTKRSTTQPTIEIHLGRTTSRQGWPHLPMEKHCSTFHVYPPRSSWSTAKMTPLPMEKHCSTFNINLPRSSYSTAPHSLWRSTDQPSIEIHQVALFHSKDDPIYLWRSTAQPSIEIHQRPSYSTLWRSTIQPSLWMHCPSVFPEPLLFSQQPVFSSLVFYSFDMNVFCGPFM